MKRLLWLRGVPVLGLLTLLQFNDVSAQAPGALGGATYDMRITAGTSPYATSGRFLQLFLGHTNYVSYKINGPLSDGAGTYSYQQTSSSTGRIGYQDLSATVLTYSSPTTGVFQVGSRTIVGVAQEGFFQAYDGQSPASLNQKVIRVDVAGGTLAFGGVTSGTYRILTTSGGYIVQNSSGETVHEGSFTYAKRNRSSGEMAFQDTAYAHGTLILAFQDSAKGLVVVRKGGTELVQIGTFVMSALRAPVFSVHPTSRSVTVGSATTFSATVTGTGPISYQWYKDNVAISGATNSTFTIPSVQLWDAGTYRLAATNLAGSSNSLNATLTPACGYSLSTNSLFVDFRGGNQSVTVLASGTCAWTSQNTNSWITITSATAGQGNAILSLLVDANDSDSPRTGFLQIAGKTLAVAQAARPALPELSGKTFLLNFTNRTQDLPLKENGLLVFSSGTNSQVQTVSFNTNIPVQTIDYLYQAVSATSAVVRIDGGDILFEFSSVKGGRFVTTNAFDTGDIQSGTFTVSASAPDFNDDGRGDLVLQGLSGGFAAWHLQNTNFLAVRLLQNGQAPNNGGRGFGSADFNRDGYADLLIQDASGRILVWFMQGTNRVGGIALRDGAAAAQWRAFSAADVNGDGHPDILFQNKNDRRITAWLFDGTTFLGGMQIRAGKPAGAGWNAMAAADLNGDLQTDILFRHQSGQISAWFLNGGEFVSVEIVREGVAPVKWRLMGAGDINEDGYTDLLWQNDSNQVATWLFEGKDFVQALFLRDGKPAGAGWKVVAPR